MELTSTDILIVDLDGTLLKSDMLYESFWSAFSSNWHSPFLSAVALCQGKVALKDYLHSASAVDVSTLPYDSNVIEYIHRHRRQGGYVALVTAANQVFADYIASHLKIFDEVFGSNDARNLKEETKLRF